MATRSRDAADAGRYETLIDWLKAPRRARAGERRAALRPARNGTGSRVEPAVEQSPFDFLTHSDVLAHLEQRMQRMREINRDLRDELEERRGAFAELSAREEHYRRLVADAPVPLFETDALGTIVFANPALFALLGYEETDVLACPAWHAAESDRDRESLRDLFVGRGRAAKEVPSAPVVIGYRRQGGETVAVEIEHTWKTDDRGRVVGAIGCMIDVTHREEAQRELSDSESLFRDLFEHAPVMLLAVDARDTTILACNDTLARATGYSKGELLDRSVFDLYAPDFLDQATETFRTFLHRGAVHDQRVRLRRKNGSTFEVLETTTSVADEGGGILAGRTVWRDLSR